MANESSLVKKQPLVGIKLDRSKCFDKIFVPIIVALGEKLGLDPRFLRTWAKLYIGFERYICWHSFISDSPIVGSNGIAQGDTSSVLAINILMSAWAMVVQSFSCIRAAVFVDDAYLYTEAQHVETLAQAVSVTEAFDTMAGQELNLSKSCIWATSNAAKKQLSRLFPNVQIEDFVEVLGGFIKASSVPKVINSPDLFQTIKNFIHDIARLPVDFRAKVRLISSKIVPKITYASEIRPWPRKSIESFTSAITYALWGNRPTWRSAEILFACATDPIRCYPPVAIAASTILNIISRCQQNGEFCQQWIEIQKHKVLKKGMLDLFIISCGVVGLTFEPPCTLRFLDFPSFHFLDLQPAALRKILRVASCQALYISLSCRLNVRISLRMVVGYLTLTVLASPVGWSHGTTILLLWMNLFTWEPSQVLSQRRIDSTVLGLLLNPTVGFAMLLKRIFYTFLNSARKLKPRWVAWNVP